LVVLVVASHPTYWALESLEELADLLSENENQEGKEQDNKNWDHKLPYNLII
jgi:hypothetical protein